MVVLLMLARTDWKLNSYHYYHSTPQLLIPPRKGYSEKADPGRQ
jgi:hypothetical protein